MKLLVGCPVLRREWIMGAWFEFVEKAIDPEWDVEYVFVCSRSDPTRKVIDVAAKTFGRIVHYVDIAEDVKTPPRSHAWNEKGSFERMVNLRNLLLEEVRTISPDLFLSLDSDILVHPQQISNLVEVLERDERSFDAVGGKVFLSGGKDSPSWCNYTIERGIKRSNIDYVAPVDVIMAVKLMSPDAYQVDYQHHHKGEDLGWSFACRARGLSLAHDGRVISKHVMEPKDDNGMDMVDKVDSRCGF